MPDHPKRAAAEGIGYASGVVALVALLKKAGPSLLQAQLLYAPVVNVEPDGTTVVSFQILATGATGPYSFSVLWGDGITGMSPNGYFVRTFSAGSTIPSSALVTVKSADGQMVQIDG